MAADPRIDLLELEEIRHEDRKARARNFVHSILQNLSLADIQIHPAVRSGQMPQKSPSKREPAAYGHALVLTCSTQSSRMSDHDRSILKSNSLPDSHHCYGHGQEQILHQWPHNF